jgi:hypothetical protein
MSSIRTPSAKVVNVRDLLVDAPAMTTPPTLTVKTKQSTAPEDVGKVIAEKQEKQQKPAVILILNAIKEMLEGEKKPKIATALQDEPTAMWVATMFFTRLATVRRNSPDLGEVKHFLSMCNDMLKTKNPPAHLKMDNEAQRLLLKAAIEYMPDTISVMHAKTLKLDELLLKTEPTPQKIEEVVEADLVESLKTRIAQLESEQQCTPTSNFRTETSTTVEDRMALADTVTKSIERVDELQKALVVQQNENTALRVQIDDLQSHVSVSQVSAQDSLVTRIAALKKENEALLVQNRELQSQVSASQVSASQVSASQVSAQDSSATPPALQKENEAFKLRIRELEGQVTFLQSQVSVQNETAREHARIALVQAETLHVAAQSNEKMADTIANVSQAAIGYSFTYDPRSKLSKAEQRAAASRAAAEQLQIGDGRTAPS